MLHCDRIENRYMGDCLCTECVRYRGIPGEADEWRDNVPRELGDKLFALADYLDTLVLRYSPPVKISF